ncbi:MAG: hypothetical protein HY579_01025 [Nitrospinae bacterium]|nr:hypothetical protein [Nitrospinota bacterium]
MFVNISRSKMLINNPIARNAHKAKKAQPRCNHCGGLIRTSGELATCIMCSREVSHVCSLCTHLPAGELLEKSKKSA